MTAIVVRPFVATDAAKLLGLMRDLARFEDYIDAFAVDEAALIRQGLGPDADFQAFVADEDGELVGMAVTYVLTWTYTLKPRVVLKELFVKESKRSGGAGRALMKRVQMHARELGAEHIAWTVMHGNRNAEAFYRRLGGQPDAKWENWLMAI